MYLRLRTEKPLMPGYATRMSCDNDSTKRLPHSERSSTMRPIRQYMQMSSRFTASTDRARACETSRLTPSRTSAYPASLHSGSSMAPLAPDIPVRRDYPTDRTTITARLTTKRPRGSRTFKV